MINKLEECLLLCEEEEWDELKNKINNDIRPKLTALKLDGKPFKNAWIIDFSTQISLAEKINEIIDSI